ncbi:DUF1818 family protein [Moorena producens]|uniref:DUF1818 family protein n=1 Tax=Moorena producens TaxID=1155739 RepID=UPI003C781F16
MERLVKHGEGWRIGWDPEAPNYKGLVGAEDWAFELTESELNDFCRLLLQLAQTMSEMANELMDEEKITCEAESDWLWMEVEGYPSAYTLRLILNQGRCCEGSWVATAVPGLLAAAKSLKVF